MALKKQREPFVIFKRKNSPYLYARFWDPDQERHTHTRSTGILDDGRPGSVAAAARVAQELLDQGLIRREDDQDVLALCRAYWRDQKGKVTEQYRRQNLDAIKKLKGSPVDGLRVAKLSRAVLNKTGLWLEAQGTGTRRLQQIIQSVSVPINFYNDLELVPFRADRLKLPAHKARRRGALTINEVRRILAIEDYPDPRVLLGALLGILAGLRRSEALGLTWADLDLDKGLLHVARSFTTEDGLHDTKTTGSRRTVELVEPLADRLRWYHAWTPCPDPDHFVLFAVPHGGRVREVSRFERRWHPIGSAPMNGQLLTDGWHKVLEAAGIPREEGRERRLSYHSGRHTFSTLLVERIGPMSAMLLTGHKKLTTLQGYLHPTRDAARAGIRQLGEDLLQNDKKIG